MVQGSFINYHLIGLGFTGAIIIFAEVQQRNHKLLKPHLTRNIQGHTALIYLSFAEGMDEGQMGKV